MVSFVAIIPPPFFFKLMFDATNLLSHAYFCFSNIPAEVTSAEDFTSEIVYHAAAVAVNVIESSELPINLPGGVAAKHRMCTNLCDKIKVHFASALGSRVAFWLTPPSPPLPPSHRGWATVLTSDTTNFCIQLRKTVVPC